MEIKLNYPGALEKYGLKESDLNEDAKSGIAQINTILRTMKANDGKNLKETTLAKIKALDKWILFEIVDQGEQTDENKDLDFTPEELEKQVKAELESKEKDDEEAKKQLEKGLAIEAELAGYYQKENAVSKTLTLEEVRDQLPLSYGVIFDNYDAEGENGVETTHYSLIETSPKDKIFTLQKK